MSQIASKNLYELLGNDPELDPNREPEPPTKVLDKPVQRTGKRNADGEAPARDGAKPAAGGRGGNQATFGREAGSLNNRDDGLRQDRHRDRLRDNRPAGERGGRGRRGARGEYRGGPGGTRHVNRDDRKSHTGKEDHEKQAAHGWGNMQDGQGEWNDEKAGEAIAQAESKNDSGLTPDANANDPAFTDGPNQAGEADVAEPEDNSKSYDDYMAELAEKRLQLSGENLAIRKPNEGSKQSFPEGKAFERHQDDYFVGSGGKNKREKEQKAKELVALDTQYYAPAEQDRPGRGRGGSRGGPRGGRSDRGRGGRGGRAEGGRGGPRPEGGRGGAPRADGARGGAPRGGPRGAGGKGFNATDASAFPALGA